MRALAALPIERPRLQLLRLVRRRPVQVCSRNDVLTDKLGVLFTERIREAVPFDLLEGGLLGFRAM